MKSLPESDHGIRVLYSFPHKFGAQRICYTAWQQVNGLAAAGADVLVFAGSLSRPVPPGVGVSTTLAWGRLRIPYRLLGTARSCDLHDRIVARRIAKLAGKIDIVHTWPSGAYSTLQTAARLGIPSVLERCSAHTRYAYEVVRQEAERLGVPLRKGGDGVFDEQVLHREEEEFWLADRLLCPSDFVVSSFLSEGFPNDRLARHIYGFDEDVYYPAPEYKPNQAGLKMLFVGYAAVGKGLHHALTAWLRSPVHQRGKFRIAGAIVPEYATKLAVMLSHPSVEVLGHRNEIAELMRDSDILVLPSVQEGFPLVCMEAMGTGCVPVVSDVCSGICQHMENSLVHRAGDVESLTQHITLIDEDRALLQKLRAAGLRIRQNLTWKAAGLRLLEVYRETIAMQLNRTDHCRVA